MCISADNPDAMCKNVENTKFSRYVVMAVTMEVLICVGMGPRNRGKQCAVMFRCNYDVQNGRDLLVLEIKAVSCMCGKSLELTYCKKLLAVFCHVNDKGVIHMPKPMPCWVGENLYKLIRYSAL